MTQRGRRTATTATTRLSSTPSRHTTPPETPRQTGPFRVQTRNRLRSRTPRPTFPAAVDSLWIHLFSRTSLKASTHGASDANGGERPSYLRAKHHGVSALP